MRKINKIFYSLQGEGYHTGTPAVFVRFSGCNLKCSFCDTRHEEGTMMTDEEIIATREKAIKVLEGRGYEIVNTLFTDEWYSKESMTERGVVQIPLCFLAKSLENMSLCHAAYFCKGWENARGCRIEHDAAKAYGLEIIYEE